MSFDNFHLSYPLLVEFYRNALVDLSSKSSAVVNSGAQEAVSIPFIGQNKQHVLVLVSYAEVPVIPDDSLNFLVKVLKQCLLNMEDITLANTHSFSGNFTGLVKTFEPAKVLILGKHAGHFPGGTEIKDFSILMSDNIKITNAPSLDDMNRDTEDGKLLKRKFWQCLKLLFEI